MREKRSGDDEVCDEQFYSHVGGRMNREDVPWLVPSISKQPALKDPGGPALSPLEPNLSLAQSTIKALIYPKG